MAYKPILFNNEMVRAILDGRKTQTRRVCKGQGDCNPVQIGYHPPYQTGDILWVRETWGKLTECNVFPPYEPEEERFIYRADIGDPDHFQAKWHPSIHMPKEAARIFLRVKDVRVERLQDMTEQDADEEGCKGCPTKPAECPEFSERDRCYHDHWYCMHTLPQAFGRDIWDSTIKPADHERYGWEANPWVWVIEFERCEKPKEW